MGDEVLQVVGRDQLPRSLSRVEKCVSKFLPSQRSISSGAMIFIADSPILHPTPNSKRAKDPKTIPDTLWMTSTSCESKEVLGLSGHFHRVREMALKTERWKRSHQLVNVYLLSTYCILGTVLSTLDLMVSKAEILLLHSRSRRQTVKT